MHKILVLYYSNSGNTERMAHAVAEGLRMSGGIDVEVKYHIDAKEMMAYNAIVIGAPTYNHDMPLEIKGILEDAVTENVDLRGRVGAAFGSYGWSGEAPDMVLEIMESRLGMYVIKPPIKVKGSPDQKDLEKCRELGRRVAKETMARSAR